MLFKTPCWLVPVNGGHFKPGLHLSIPLVSTKAVERKQERSTRSGCRHQADQILSRQTANFTSCQPKLASSPHPRGSLANPTRLKTIIMTMIDTRKWLRWWLDDQQASQHRTEHIQAWKSFQHCPQGCWVELSWVKVIKISVELLDGAIEVNWRNSRSDSCHHQSINQYPSQFSLH